MDVLTDDPATIAGRFPATRRAAGGLDEYPGDFERMARRGMALKPGQWISSGAVSGVHDALAGQVVEARFADRFSVACRLTAARAENA